MDKYYKYKKKYLQIKNQQGGMMDNVLVEAMRVENNENCKMLISFENSYIYNYRRDASKPYLIYKKDNNNTFLLLDLHTNPIEIKCLCYNNGRWYITSRDLATPYYNILNYQEFPRLNFNNLNKKIVIFIRHGESEANRTHNHELPHPELSDKGMRQAETLSEKLIRFDEYLKTSIPTSFFNNYNKGIELAVISPLKRTLLTALPTLTRLPDIPVRSNILCTEATSNQESNKGYSTTREYLEFCNSTLPDRIRINDDEYNDWYNMIWKNFEDDNDNILINYRCKLFNDYLKSRNEKVIVIFTHYNFIKKYFEEVLGLSKTNLEYKMNADRNINSFNNTDFIPIFHD
jgi:broad specificity phosphatase PhoE